MSSYNRHVVTQFLAEFKIPAPEFEYKFHPTRKWRFDLAWPMIFGRHPGAFPLVAIEVQGGIWGGGRHNRGAAMLKEWDKLNEAAAMGWRILYCQPRDLCTFNFVSTLKRALNL